MFLVLLFLAALGQLAAGRVNFTKDVTGDISNCSVSFYGFSYTTFYIGIESDKLAICFRGPYPAATSNDCVLIEKGSLYRGFWETKQTVKEPGSDFHTALPSLTDTSTCHIRVTFYDTNSEMIHIYFRRFGSRQAVRIAVEGITPPLVTVQASGLKYDQWLLQTVTFKEMSGCRQLQDIYAPGTFRCLYKGVFQSCRDDLRFQTGPCSAGVVQCRCSTVRSTCSVTGSTIVDFYGKTTNVTDRCTYSLMSDGGVHVLAVFKDRRRKDVSLVDSVILYEETSGSRIDLEQGGIVKIMGTVLDLSSPQGFDDILISKNQTGVTVTYFNMGTVTEMIFFDGITAQIHTTVYTEPSTQGACASATTPLSASWWPEFSPSGCETQYPEPPDNTISCNAMAERCNELLAEPFTACHSKVDPAAYVSACNETLCEYPAVDGFSPCRFMEAYVQACNFNTSNIVKDDWRTTASCPPPQAFCQDTLCSPQEFCADGIKGGVACFCRAIFASSYKTAGSIGDTAVCSQNVASVSLYGCFLEERGIAYTDLHLNNQSCRGQIDNVTHMVTFSFDGNNACGTVVAANSSHLIFKNSIMSENRSDVANRYDNIEIDFSCFYTQPGVQSVFVKAEDNAVIQQLVSGQWNYTLSMTAYTNEEHTEAIDTNTRIKLQQVVWVELKADELDGNMVVLVTDSCWATNEASPSASLRYELVVNGCPNPTDQTVKVENNGLGTSNFFSFRMFHFSDKNNDVHLHCQLHLCENLSGTCAPSCGGGWRRRRRSVRAEHEDGDAALITMSWTH